MYYIAVRDDAGDVILFDSLTECRNFCIYNQEYSVMQSTVHTFQSAREIFE